MKTKEKLFNRVCDLIAQGNIVLESSYPSTYKRILVDSALLTGFRAATLSFLNNLFGQSHSYYDLFDSESRSNNATHVKSALEILNQVKIEIQGDWIFTIKKLLHAELFADFAEMAQHLLDTGYKDPAAVIIGSLLEEHLRQLCISGEISSNEQNVDKGTYVKADRLNADLAKAGVYNKLDQKNVTAWLDLRNNAAHGKYSMYNDDQVKQMMIGVISFITTNQTPWQCGAM